jgi:hypothetical protein
MVDYEFVLNFYSESCLQNAARVAKGAGSGLLSSPISRGRKKEKRGKSCIASKYCEHVMHYEL